MLLALCNCRTWVGLELHRVGPLKQDSCNGKLVDVAQTCISRVDMAFDFVTALNAFGSIVPELQLLESFRTTSMRVLLFECPKLGHSNNSTRTPFLQPKHDEALPGISGANTSLILSPASASQTRKSSSDTAGWILNLQPLRS